MKILIALLLLISTAFGSPFTLKMVDGEVSVVRGLKKLTVKEGMELQYNDRISTKEGARAQIQFGEGNVILLNENSRTKLTKEKEETVIDLSEGVVRCRLKNLENKKFAVRTPSAVAGVRGTDFVVEYNK